MKKALSLLFLLCLLVGAVGCPTSADDDDATIPDDDDVSSDDDDSGGDDDDATGDDDDATGDDDDATGDDDDATGTVDDDGDGSPVDADCDDGDPSNYPGNTEVCDGQDNDCDDETMASGEETDGDGDGSVECLDCDDSDSGSFPGNLELCDGVDNDCNPLTVAVGEETDLDGDGTVACLDCDDSDSGNFPGNVEVCDGFDNDCSVLTVFAGEDTDIDGDGTITCLDCDDSDGGNFPGNTEACDSVDNDCAPLTMFPGEDTDIDGDGAVTCLDCDDSDAANFLGNVEVCDGADNDCNALSDADAAGEVDGDGDLSLSCVDCDDSDINNTPGGVEVCDGADNDCDALTVFPDEDVNVDGDASAACDDCDDSDPANFVGNLELCDGGDNDCDGLANFGAAGEWTMEDSVTGTVTFAPLTLTTPTVLTLLDDELSAAIPLPFPFDFAGSARTDVYVHSNGFVNFDGLVNTNVHAPLELGRDDALNEFIAVWWNDLNPALGGSISYGVEGAAPNRVLVVDWDAVPYYNQTTPGMATSETVTVQLQLHESNIVEIHVSAADAQPADFANQLASELDPAIGIEGVPPASDVYLQGDPFASVSNTAIRFVPEEEQDVDGDGVSFCAGDCSDSDPLIYPLAVEICDGLDTDCDGAADFAGETTDVDLDQDVTCSDCDDGDGENFNGNLEACDGQDNDCNGLTDFAGGESDVDLDGVLSCLDCDDADGANYPGNVEVCDGGDNDCDAIVDLSSGYLDSAPASSISTVGTAIITETIMVPFGGTIEDLDVFVGVTHTFNEQLEVSLSSPTGTTVDLFTQVGGDADGIDIQLDDESSNSLPVASTVLLGDYQPESDSLSAFDGEVAGGIWTITVVDDVLGDGGSLDYWALEFNVSNPGATEICAAPSCDDILIADAASVDGAYWLDGAGLGVAALYTCDMTTSGGGWTKVFDWDRQNDGDGITEFEAAFDSSFSNGMGVYTELANSLRWQDGNTSYDALEGTASVDVPNTGEVLYDIRFVGSSMEASGVWFGVGTSGGNEELWCVDDASSNNGYSGSELSGVPYACGSYTSSPNNNPGVLQAAFGGVIDSVFLYAMMHDANGGDDAQLFRYEVWVR